MWRAGEFRERRYGIPLDMHPLGLLRTSRCSRRPGSIRERLPADRASFEEALDELKGKGVQGNWVSPFFFTGGLMFQSLMWQFGGDLMDDGRRAGGAGTPTPAWRRWSTCGAWIETRGRSPDNVAQDADNIAFKNGESAFIWQGAWGWAITASTDGLEWKLTPLPRIGDQTAAWANSHQFVVLRTMDEGKLQQATQVSSTW